MSGMVLSLVEPVGAGVRENRGTASAEDLRRIIHKAILARQFAAVHKQTVRQCLRAARVAARRGENDLAVLLLGDARAEHAEVQACVRVARVLERQAEEMGKRRASTGRPAAPVPQPQPQPQAMTLRQSTPSPPRPSLPHHPSPARRRRAGPSAAANRSAAGLQSPRR